MKRIIFMFFPVLASAQVSMQVTPLEIVSPGDNQSFMEVAFTSHVPVRIDQCTIEFADDWIFDYVDHLVVYQDTIELPVLSAASEFLFNPWEHYPSIYVGIGNDTSITLDYRLDTYQYYAQDVELQFSCLVHYYTDPNIPDTTCGPVNVSSGVVLGIDDGDADQAMTVRCVPGGLDITIDTRLCEPVLIVDMSGKVLEYLYSSRTVYLAPGMYVVCNESKEYVGTYMVM
ncbi:MAG: hypothetical protein KBC22_00730 [Candidatus Pacebacteria bacterium]|nr:hypothetical protein [Candidatus Paceibacterota bacterium]